MAFTPEVLDAQTRYGSRTALARLGRVHPAASSAATPGARRADAPRRMTGDPLTEDEQWFLADLDGFYLATVSATGWPYVQFRGGPPGFIRTPDAHTIAWADFRGNRQYISMGNLSSDDRVAMIFLDYARQLRLKVYGHAHVVDVPTGTTITGEGSAPQAGGEESSLAVPGYRAKVEREVRVEVTAYDWNCQQHITRRFSAEELAPGLEALHDQVSALQADNARLQERLDQVETPRGTAAG